MSEIPVIDHNQLLELIKARMPFGKYEGWLIIDIPEDYLVWFASKGVSRREGRQDDAGCLRV